MLLLLLLLLRLPHPHANLLLLLLLLRLPCSLLGAAGRQAVGLDPRLRPLTLLWLPRLGPRLGPLTRLWLQHRLRLLHRLLHCLRLLLGGLLRPELGCLLLLQQLR